MSQRFLLEQVRRQFRTGHYSAAVAMAVTADIAAEEFPEIVAYSIRALAGLGRYRAAADAGMEAERRALTPRARLLLRLVSRGAAVVERLSVDRRRAVQEAVEEAKTLPDPLLRGYAGMIAARMIQMEVGFQLRSTLSLAESKSLYEQSAAEFEAAGRLLEALDLLVSRAELIQRGIPPASADISGWKDVHGRSLLAGDVVVAVRSALELRNMELTEALNLGDPTAAATAEQRFQDITAAYVAAGMAEADTSVKEVWGLSLLRFGHQEGIKPVSEAADGRARCGQVGRADALLRDLHLWHLRRGELSEAKGIINRIAALPPLETELRHVTEATLLSFDAFARSDSANARAYAAAVSEHALTPGQQAGLFIQEASALTQRGARAEAVVLIERAVGLLRPAAPCCMLGDALSCLGSVLGTDSEIRRLWREAADVDRACGQEAAAAGRLLNLAESLARPGRVSGEDALAIDQLVSEAEELITARRDAEALSLFGKLALCRAQLAFALGDLGASAAWFSKAESKFVEAGNLADVAFTQSRLGLCWFSAAERSRDINDWERSHACLVKALKNFRRLELHSEEVRTGYLAAIAAFEKSNLTAAARRTELREEVLRRLGEAAEVLEEMRSGCREPALADAQASREQFASQTGRIYDFGIRFCSRVSMRSDLALEWVERSKSRALLDSMADLSCGLRAPRGTDSILTSREVQLEEEIRTISAEMIATSGSDRCLMFTRHLQALHNDLRTAWKSMASRPESSAYGTLRLGRPVNWHQIRTLLADGPHLPKASGKRVVMVHFLWPFLTDKRRQVEMVVSRGDFEFPAFIPLQVDPEQIMGLARSWFGGGTSRSGLRGYLKDTGGDPEWMRSYAALVAPLAELTEPGDLLVLVPSGPLHSLPLQVLEIGGIPLIERNPVVHVPSAAILLFCLGRRRERANRRLRSLVAGCSGAVEGFPPLNGVVQGARRIAGLEWFDSGDGAVVDEELTRNVLLDRLPSTEVFHFVGHAVESINGWDSALILPRGERLTARDLTGLRLDTGLVTLSGCRTARSRWVVGDECLGLTPALLHSGSRSVLSSQWEVGSEPTAMLMHEFYRRAFGDPDMSKSEALRVAVLKVREHYPSFADWGAFSLHGDWF